MNPMGWCWDICMSGNQSVQRWLVRNAWVFSSPHTTNQVYVRTFSVLSNHEQRSLLLTTYVDISWPGWVSYGFFLACILQGPKTAFISWDFWWSADSFMLVMNLSTLKPQPLPTELLLPTRPLKRILVTILITGNNSLIKTWHCNSHYGDILI